MTAFFGFQPGDKTPFRDVRMRQAWSMAMDRDLFLDTFGNADKFKSGGVPIDTFWHAALPKTAFKGWPLDPKAKDFGPNGQYFQHNIAEAKKLMSAAGYSSSTAIESHQIGGPDYGALYPKGSANKKELDRVIKQLIDDGTLAKLSAVYLGSAFGQDPAKIPYFTVDGGS